MEHEFKTPQITDKLYYTYCQRYLTVHINCLTANLRPRELIQNIWYPRKFDPAKIKHFTVLGRSLDVKTDRQDAWTETGKLKSPDNYTNIKCQQSDISIDKYVRL